MNPIVEFIFANAILSFYINSIPFDTIRYDSYDFIIIGGGSAGALVARRLSDVPKFKVLLLDRGGVSSNYYSNIPYIVNLIGYKNPLVTEFKSVKQSKACGSTNGICTMSAGNGFGGGSSVNGLLYARGSSLDYDDWENRYGAVGWSYKNVIPFFKSIENYFGSQHNRDKLIITAPKDYPRIQSALMNAYVNYGDSVGNYNHGLNPAVTSISHDVIGNGRRQSSWNVFLEPVIHRDNLDIISFASVNKIKFDKNKRAISVSFVKNGFVRNISVSKEVIVSAGAIDTPKILLLSGIGDKIHLMKVGVNPIVSNLNSVGKNFQDQIKIVVNITFPPINEEPTGYDLTMYAINSRDSILRKNNNIITRFITDKYASKSDTDTRIQNQFILDKANNRILVLFYVLGSKTRGTIKLASTDPNIDPLIDPNYYESKEDMPILKRALKDFAIFISESEILRDNNIRIKSQYIDRCGTIDAHNLMNNETFLDCFIRMNTISSIHMGSSCRMGNRNDPLSCADSSNLKVLGGIKNVRVIDASVMPQVTRGNTNAPTTMIAERGSLMIINDYGYTLNNG